MPPLAEVGHSQPLDYGPAENVLGGQGSSITNGLSSIVSTFSKYQQGQNGLRLKPLDFAMVPALSDACLAHLHCFHSPGVFVDSQGQEGFPLRLPGFSATVQKCFMHEMH